MRTSPILCGVRVSLYFPGDRLQADQLIRDQFHILESKQFPEQSKPPTYHKRFSGYWANHYRVYLRRRIGTTLRKTLLPGQNRNSGSVRPDARLV